MVRIVSDFNDGAPDFDGWTVPGATVQHLGNYVGNRLERRLAAQDDVGSPFYFVAPAKFLGDKSVYYGGTLSFKMTMHDRAQPSASWYDNPEDVILTGAGLTLVLDKGARPHRSSVDVTTWSEYVLDLSTDAGWRVGSSTGALATEAQIRAVLADLTDLRIRGEHMYGTERTLIDDITLASPETVFSDAVIFSDFNRGIEGWTTEGGARDLVYVENGGPTTGDDSAIRASDATGGYWYFAAADKFLGDRAAFLGGTIAWSLKTSGTSTNYDQPSVVLEGGGLVLVARDTPEPNGSSFTDYSIDLNIGQWRVGDLNGTVATEAQLRQVLADLQKLLIRGEYIGGADSAYLDNVQLRAAPGDYRVYRDIAAGGLLAVADDFAQALAAAQNGQLLTMDAAHVTGSALQTLSPDLTIDMAAGTFLELTMAGAAARLVLRGDAGIVTAAHVTANTALASVVDGRDLTGDSTLIGGDLGDWLVGGSGEDLLQGGAGDDDLQGNGDDDSLDGGGGDDSLQGNDGRDSITGGIGNDIMSGGNDDDSMNGSKGNDWINGDAGHDDLTGAAGNDTVNGGDGDDILRGRSGADSMSGDAGMDTLVGGGGDDILDGGDDNDRIRGQAGADVADGGAGDDSVYGGIGNDTLAGGGGADILRGGGGADSMSGNTGADTLHGQGGDDLIEGGKGGDVLNGGNGDDAILGNAGNDTLVGGDGDDSLYGGTGNDVLKGKSGKDALFGQSGHDRLLGGQGGEWLAGGGGNDTLTGGGGDDRLTGGNGMDVFVFDSDNDGSDRIRDFQEGIDTIRLDGISGVSQFSDLSIVQSGNNTVVTAGAVTITVVGVAATDLTASDFDIL